MYVVGIVVFLAGVIAFFYGLFLGLFKKGRRGKGWLIVLVGMFAAPLGGDWMRSATGELGSDDATGATIAVASSEDGNAGAQLGSSVELDSEGPVEPAVHDPDLAVLERRSSLAIYCEMLVEYDAIYREAQERFAENEFQEQIAWERGREDEITTKMTNELDVAASRVMAYASDNGWDHRCEAIERGWKQVELDDIRAATGDDRNRVEEAVELNYIQRLDRNEGGFFFDQDNFEAVRCGTRRFGDWNIVGCHMVGGWNSRLARSSTAFYVAARQGGEPVIVPIDSQGEEHMIASSLPDVRARQIPLGKYVGPYPALPGLDWAEVKDHFDE